MAKTSKKSKSSTKNARFNVLTAIYERVLSNATVTRSGEVKMKRGDLKTALEEVMMEATKRAAKGERVRFPVIGALAMRPVKARSKGKGVNPFTGEPMEIKARPESRKPRWSFPKAVKEVFANKRNWA